MIKTPGLIQRNSHAFAFFYRLADMLFIQLSLAFSMSIYGTNYNQQYFQVALIGSATYLFVAESVTLYRSWRTGSFKEIVFYTFLSWTLAGVAVLFYLFFTKFSMELSRVTMAIWFVTGFFLLISWRSFVAKCLSKYRSKGFNTRDVAIIGFTQCGQQLAQQIAQRPDSGFRLRAVFDDREIDRLAIEYQHLYQGNVEEGVERVKNNEFDAIYIALPMGAEERINNILFLLGNTTANVHVVPDSFVCSLLNSRHASVGDVQTVSVFENPFNGASASLKRFEDIILSLIILTIIAIPMLVIAIGIKLTSKGPVLFKQDRYGLDGKKIKVWKFRSMTVTENADVVVQATRNDARITPFGAFLRRTSLDELPQFFNTLAGSMSVVGPRPHAIAHNEEYRKQVGFYMLRHKVKPGITGWAQVNGWRGETDTLEKMEMRIQFDLEYIKNWSLWMDVKIVFFTIARSFNDKNAY